MTSKKRLQQIILDLQAAEMELSLHDSGTMDHLKLVENSTPQNTVIHGDAQKTEAELILKNELLSSSLTTMETQLASSKSEIKKLRSENEILGKTIHKAKVENAQQVNENNNLSAENELLINKIYQVQEELERYYVDKIAMENALAESQETLESARLLICRLNKEP